MRKPNLIRSAVTLLTVLGFTLPSGLAAAETINSEINSTISSQVSDTTDSTATSEMNNEVDSQSPDSALSTESTAERRSSPEKAAKSSTTVPIQMLGINDFHGALSTTGSYYGADGAKVSGAGTAALLAGYFSQAESTFKQKNSTGKTLRVQAGDMVGASPANSGLLQDQPTMRILNQMKFDVGTLGNHEFDEGLGEFNRILTGTKPDPTSDFYQIVEDYNNDYTQDQLKGGFDLVIANVRDKNTGDIPYGWKPYTIKNVGTTSEPIKIGYIGVVTTEIPNLVLAKYHEDYNFTDPADEIVKYSKELVNQGVNAIVVLGHTPSVQGACESVSGETADIMTKVNQVDPNNSVDAFFAGHNHVYTNGVVGNTRIVQSTSQGKGYIDLQGEYDTATNDFISTPKATVNPVDPNGGVTPDATVKEIVDDADTRVKDVTDEKIGTADKAEDITRTVNELGESPVGNLVTDAQVYMAKKNGEDVDFAMTNNGGIRDDLKVKADSSITWGAAQAVQPFGNIMQIVEMTGQQIENVLNQQSDKYFLQVSGLKYTVEKNGTSSVVKEIKKADDIPIEANKTYKLIINDFLYGGGDGFSEFTNANLTGALDPDTETFIGYIKDLEANGKKVSAKIEGRKTLAVVDPAAEETEKIKSDTKLNELHEGDTHLTGTTIPNATVSVEAKETKSRALPQGITSDKDGNFSIALDQLEIKEGKELTVTITGPNNGKSSFAVKVLAKTPVVDPKEEETQKIMDSTKLDELFEGDQYLTGITIPNATIEVAVPEVKSAEAAVPAPMAKVAAQAAEEPKKTDAEGKFKIDVQNLKLQAGQEVVVSVIGPNGGSASFRTPVLAKAGTDPAADEETTRIKKETTLNDIHEGDTTFTGKTIANATIDLSVVQSGKFALGKSDGKGNIILDIAELALKKDQKITITITGVNGGAYVFEKTVLERKIISSVNNGTSNSTHWIENAIGKIYPNTGEGKQPIFVVLGMVVLSASGLIYFKRK
ncbi:bifunctional metallophosphatase/5'-nucleotidase [Enterococcus malodoratus]|uniref:bifunctional metallophosphatase/5'-nucleotidase n=1 Tax=Enterococcus malodoratus TaxID=71451 RepID=UPI0020736ADB|nr:bifunctional metallophosphatase/5'-nucleotidase [Enterococcus malodoratus]